MTIAIAILLGISMLIIVFYLIAYAIDMSFLEFIPLIILFLLLLVMYFLFAEYIDDVQHAPQVTACHQVHGHWIDGKCYNEIKLP